MNLNTALPQRSVGSLKSVFDGPDYHQRAVGFMHSVHCTTCVKEPEFVPEWSYRPLAFFTTVNRLFDRLHQNLAIDNKDRNSCVCYTGSARMAQVIAQKWHSFCRVAPTEDPRGHGNVPGAAIVLAHGPTEMTANPSGAG